MIFVFRNWIFGSIYCTINNFIAYLSVAASVFTLMAISIDRYDNMYEEMWISYK